MELVKKYYVSLWRERGKSCVVVAKYIDSRGNVFGDVVIDLLQNTRNDVKLSYSLEEMDKDWRELSDDEVAAWGL